jgi:hypothetical protein
MLRVLHNRVHSAIFVRRREEGIGNWRKLCNDNNCYTLLQRGREIAGSERGPVNGYPF